MIRISKKAQECLIVTSILLLAFALRSYRYGEFPTAGETKDEYAWSWLGQSILEGRPPTSWSWFDHYKNKEMIEIGGNAFPIVWPAFDHPPLFSLIPGIMTQLTHTPWLTLPSIKVIRFPMIILGTLNVGLLYWSVRRIENKEVALIAALLYATIPTFVFSSRMALAENLLITWIFLALVTLHAKISEQRRLLLLGFLCALAALTKVAGLLLPIGLALYFLPTKHFRQLTVVIFGAGAGFLAWAAWASFYDFQSFIDSFGAQAGRPIGFGSLFSLFFRPNVADRPYLDGWVYLGFFGLIVLFFTQIHSRSTSLLRSLTAAWLLFYVATTGETTYHGWYRYPLFPLMTWAVASLAFNNQKAALFPLVLFGGLTQLRMIYLQLNNEFSALLQRLLLTTAVLPLIFQKLPKLLFSLIFSGLILINIYSILTFSLDGINKDVIEFFTLEALLP